MRLAPVVVLAALSVLPALASEPDPIKEAVTVSRVRWPVAVKSPRTDSDPVGGCGALRPESFRAIEDGRPVRITAAERVTDPTLFVFVVDGTRSMDLWIQGVKAAVLRAAAKIVPTADVMLVSFGETITVHTPATRDLAALERGLAEIPVYGNTALCDAMRQLFDVLEPIPARKALVVLSDGADNSSARQDLDLARLATRGGRDLRVCSILLTVPDGYVRTGGHPDERNVEAPLRILGQSTNGAFRAIDTARKVDRTVEVFRQRIASEVVLTYVPAVLPHEAIVDGVPAIRPVRVEVTAAAGFHCRVREITKERLVLPPEPDGGA